MERERKMAEAFARSRGGDELAEMILAGGASGAGYDRLFEREGLFEMAQRLEQEVKCAPHGSQGMAGLRLIEDRTNRKTILGFVDGSALCLGDDGVSIGSWPHPERLSAADRIVEGAWRGEEMRAEEAKTLGAKLAGGAFGAEMDFFAALCLSKSRDYFWNESPTPKAPRV